MFKIKVNQAEYTAKDISGKISDVFWDDRSSKAITLEMPYSQVSTIFKNDVPWSIVSKKEIRQTTNAYLDWVKNPVGEAPEEYETIIKDVEYDNSDYCVLGDIIVHTNGTCTVNMGKPTDLEEVLEALLSSKEDL